VVLLRLSLSPIKTAYTQFGLLASDEKKKTARGAGESRAVLPASDNFKKTTKGGEHRFRMTWAEGAIGRREEEN
jgi:hypothetical protein